MATNKKWSELKKDLSPERRMRIAEDVARMEQEMALGQLRKAMNMTQAQIAEASGLSQPAVSQMEQRGDFLVSTLRRYIEAMNGNLVLTAHFPQGEATISLDQLVDTGRKELKK